MGWQGSPGLAEGGKRRGKRGSRWRRGGDRPGGAAEAWGREGRVHGKGCFRASATVAEENPTPGRASLWVSGPSRGDRDSCSRFIEY